MDRSLVLSEAELARGNGYLAHVPFFYILDHVLDLAPKVVVGDTGSELELLGRLIAPASASPFAASVTIAAGSFEFLLLLVH